MARVALLWAALAPGAASAADAGAPDGAEARPQAAALRVEYVAPPACPTAAEFEALVCGRAERACDALEGGRAPRLRVELRQSAAGASGQLFVERDGEETDVRTLHGRTCADVVEALALTAALSIDPAARAAPAPLPSPQRASSPSPPAPVSTPTPRWGARVGVSVGLARIVSPGTMPFAGLVGEVEAPWRWLPTLRTSLNGASNVLATDRVATFSLFAVEVEACPVRLRLARMALAPCGAFEGGALRGTGRGQPTVFTETRAWAAAGATVHLRIGLGSRAAVELGAGGLVPFRERDFVLEAPSRALSRTAPISWRASLGASWALP